MNKNEVTTETTTITSTDQSIPCGWCDQDVAVDDDHGQVVYCSEECTKSDEYTEGAI